MLTRRLNTLLIEIKNEVMYEVAGDNEEMVNVVKKVEQLNEDEYFGMLYHVKDV